MKKKLEPVVKTHFDPKSQPGYESRFGNFAFNRFFGDLQASKPTPGPSKKISTSRVYSDQAFYGSRQIPQVIPSRAYKKGKTP